MTKLLQNDSMFQGQDVSPFYVDVLQDGSPKNMTGMTPTWYLFFSPRASLADVILQKPGTIGDGAATGDRAFITLVPSDTASIIPGRYHWEMWVNDGAYDVPVAIGALTIESSPVGAG